MRGAGKTPEQQTLAFDEAGVDDLASLNTLTIVMELPKQQLADGLGIFPVFTTGGHQ